MEEKDLYLPVKKLFEQMNFQVYGEVNTVDVIAQRDDLIIAVELKKDLNLHLLAQGAQRQKLTEHVYLAIPAPTTRVQRGSAFRDKVYLMRRLGIGLIFVTFTKKSAIARIIHEPNLLDILSSQRKNKRKRLALIKEISQRHIDYNTGGTRGKIITAYRENALRILQACQDGETYKAADIRHITGIEKSRQILYHNHYGWFQRTGHGRYAITDAGRHALKEYAEVLEHITEENNDV